MLIDDLANEVQYLLEADHDLVAERVATRRRFESWLQRKAAEALSSKYGVLRREQPYPTHRAWCDFFAMEKDETESWVELKLCVTNYAQSFAARCTAQAITQQISSVVADIEKLRRLSSAMHRGMLLLAYPMTENYATHPAWTKHLAIISSAGATVAECFSIRLRRNGASANVVGYTVTLGGACAKAA